MINIMNWDQIAGALRIVLPGMLTYAAGRGWISTSAIPDIVAAIVTLGGAVWSVRVHSNQGKVASVAAMAPREINTATAALPAQAKIAIAAALPEVKAITTTTKALADAVPSTKVTT